MDQVILVIVAYQRLAAACYNKEAQDSEIFACCI